MFEGLFHIAYLGPGGPEFLMIMLVLLVMFGAKDAPRILRKINEIINQVRNTADGFKREVMYGDLNQSKPAYTPPEDSDDPDHDADDSSGEDYDDSDYGYGDEDESSEEVFQSLEDDLKEATATEQPEPEIPVDEDDDARQT